jgi:zinc transporter ZupT
VLTLRLPGWLLAVFPLLTLGVLLWVFVRVNPLEVLTGNLPPVEELSIERIELRPTGMVAHVVNAGPAPVTLAQVQVDDAYWSFDVRPSPTLPRFGRATLIVPYPWVEGEAHVLRLITSSGVTFEREIEVAVATPRPDLRFWLLFALLGFYVGVVPVGLGLMWFPLLGELGRRGLNFILALTVGLLLFLLVDTVLEGIEVAQQIPDTFQALPLIVFAGLLSFLVLVAIGRSPRVTGRGTRSGRLWLATMIALGIGLHNLGEGMAIGAAVALGEAALGTFLVVGFTLHNITEGLGIGAPMAHDRPGPLRLAGLALLAGAPAILGTWIGGFSYSPLLAVLFLAIGAGAILQVVYEMGRLLAAPSDRSGAPATAWVNVGGLAAGIAIMYLTAFLVKF